MGKLTFDKYVYLTIAESLHKAYLKQNKNREGIGFVLFCKMINHEKKDNRLNSFNVRLLIKLIDDVNQLFKFEDAKLFNYINNFFDFNDETIRQYSQYISLMNSLYPVSRGLNN